MSPYPRLLRWLGLALGFALSVFGQNTVFDDAFTTDSLNPSEYPAVTSNSTGWVVLSNKAAPAPELADNILTINMASTSSGFVEAQARFASSPVQLLPGTYIEVVATFVPTNVVTSPSDNLILGLFNSGGSAPLAGLTQSKLSSGSSDFATGGAKGWLGYNANIPYPGATLRMTTRPAQTGTTNVVQSVLVGAQSSSVGYASGANFSSQSGSSVATFVNGNVYTAVYRLTLSGDGLTLTASISVYNGEGTTGTGANTLIGTFTGSVSGSNLLTTSFDALGIGWRADASALSDIALSSLQVLTTGGAPWFTTQPAEALMASAGSDLTIVTVVEGNPTSLQWQKSTDGGGSYSDINTGSNASAATASLTLSGIQEADAGKYRLKATNDAGTSYSSVSTVTYSTGVVAPSITTQPSAVTVLEGVQASFSVAANGTTPLTYQWQRSTNAGASYSDIGGATSSSYSINSPALADEGLYRVVITNSAGTETSTGASLTVNQALAITTQPEGATLALGANHTLSVSVTGRPAATYQWYLNGSAISGATDSSYAITSASGAHTGLYTVVASNTAGDQVTSNVAAVAVVNLGLSLVSRSPLPGASSVLPDSRLTLNFSAAVQPGRSGTIKIYDASNPATPVDTIDLVAANALMTSLRSGSTLSTQALPVQNQSIGGLSNFNYYPMTVSGTTLTLYPRNKVLTYGKSYYVTIDAGAVTDSSGLCFAGFSDASSWSFSTKASGPDSGATTLKVEADGSGDFATLQGALDFIPSGNTTARTILVGEGTYFEQVYFASKHNLSILGKSRTGTVITYPNNNNFNNVGGSYHRMVMQADHANGFTLANLTINNSTPKGGSQAEALIVNGNSTGQAILTGLDLVSFQDTLQVNGSCYVGNSHISGDVDFIWGNGPCFLDKCRLTLRSSNAYVTQIRNGSGARGFVFFECIIEATEGVTGNVLARINPNVGSFPYSEVVWLNCTMGSSTGGIYSTPISATGWKLDNTSDQSSTSAPDVHFWEYNSHYPDGALVNVASRIGASRQLTLGADAATITNYSTPSWVLGNGWTPSLAPLIVTAPEAQSVTAGMPLELSVAAVGIPAPTFQWKREGVEIPGATGATYSVSASSTSNAGSYTVVVTSGGSTVTSTPVAVTVAASAPLIVNQPEAAEGLLGATATFSVRAVGDGPFTYQWSHNGEEIPGATRPSLRLTGLAEAAAGSYSVEVSNAAGSTPSSEVTLTVVTPLSAVPELPVIPDRVYYVTDYGAVGDGSTDNTAAIAAALTALSGAGGGTLEFPAADGAYLSGPITLASNINLQLNCGAILQALPFGTYPNSTTSPKHFITTPSGSSNVELSGGGTIEGNGLAWWTQYDLGNISSRPRLVQFNSSNHVLATGITIQNSPQFHFACSGANRHFTLFGLTIYAPDEGPNTDGVDYSGQDFLAQGCNVSVGDDNIVAKPGSEFCARIVIAGCQFGTGHGVSVGGQTNAGLDGMTVMNCSFEGTSTGLRLKADPTQGGPVRNVTYKDITMNNVNSPILVYSYYSTIGTPGNTGSSGISTAKAANYNNNPPESLGTSTMPEWSNIRFSNITITNAKYYSMIWGLPNRPVHGVTLENISLSGVAGWRIYNAHDIHFTGTQTGTLTGGGPVRTLYNASVFTAPPALSAVSKDVTLYQAVEGSSGTSSVAPQYQWLRDAVALTDGVQADGSTVSGSTTATLSITNVGSSLAASYRCRVSAKLDSYDPSGGTPLNAQLEAEQLGAPVALTGSSGAASLDAGSIDGAVAYQWQRYNSSTGSWEDLAAGDGISGQTTRTLALSGLSSIDDGALYRCVVQTGTIPLIVGETRLSVRASRLINMSARVPVAEGETVIPGFVASGSRRVLVRAIGPGLLPYGISEYLPDPRLEFHTGSGQEVSNDDWDGSAGAEFSRVGAFGLSSGSKDAALVQEISGSNTAYLNCPSGSGVALAELFDTSRNGTGRLVNCSARANVDSGDKIIVAGFVIDGNVPLRVLIRGIGPGLNQFPGVSGTLPNPRILLYKSGDLIGGNDDWDSSLVSVARSLGAFDITEGSTDAAMLVTLEPGLYTVELRSADSQSGNALLEVYEARE